MIGVLAMKNQILKKIYRVVLYLRLSSDDGDNKESDSISNQRILTRGYLDGKSEFVIVKEFVDDGFTGTNFDRPDFQKMMNFECAFYGMRITTKIGINAKPAQ